MTTFTRALYWVLGVFTLLAAAVVPVEPQVALPPDAFSPLTAHLMREEAALFVFVGLMSFWCLRHYSQRRPVHLALLTFAAIFAGIHVWGYVQHPDSDHIRYALPNVLPVALLTITAPFRQLTRDN
jgi:hypothetical protein